LLHPLFRPIQRIPLMEEPPNRDRPPNDAASLTTGKMIIESLDSVICYSDTNDVFKLTMSILETANA